MGALTGLAIQSGSAEMVRVLLEGGWGPFNDDIVGRLERVADAMGCEQMVEMFFRIRRGWQRNLGFGKGLRIE